MNQGRKLASSRICFLLQGLVGACFLSCSSADAAPKTVKSRVIITAYVAAVDCTNRPVKTKACAPVIVTREMPELGKPPAVTTTVLFY
jgi:hypothetical protein